MCYQSGGPCTTSKCQHVLFQVFLRITGQLLLLSWLHSKENNLSKSQSHVEGTQTHSHPTPEPTSCCHPFTYLNCVYHCAPTTHIGRQSVILRARKPGEGPGPGFGPAILVITLFPNSNPPTPSCKWSPTPGPWRNPVLGPYRTPVLCPAEL